MPRSINSAVRAEFEDPRSTDPLLHFLTLEASGLDTPLRLVNDNATRNGTVCTYTYGGKSFTSFPFDIKILSDDAQAPRGLIEVPNVGRELGEIIDSIRSRVRVTLWTVLPASDFDLTVNPRTLIASAHPIYTVTGMEIRNIKVDAMMVTGDLAAVDDTAEPWPAVRATQDRFPGLFR